MRPFNCHSQPMVIHTVYLPSSARPATFMQTDPGSLVYTAAYHGNMLHLKKLLQRHANELDRLLKWPHPHGGATTIGATAIYVACEFRHTDAVKMLRASCSTSSHCMVATRASRRAAASTNIPSSALSAAAAIGDVAATRRRSRSCSATSRVEALAAMAWTVPRLVPMGAADAPGARLADVLVQCMRRYPTSFAW